MTWFRMDDTMVEHEKILSLSDRAFRVHFEAISYCSRLGNGGRLSEVAAKRLNRYSETIRDELVEHLVWIPSGDGWVVFGWEKRQRTADEIDAIREKRREAGRRGGLRSGQSRSGKQTKQSGEAKPEALIEPTTRHDTTQGFALVPENPPSSVTRDSKGSPSDDQGQEPVPVGQVLAQLGLAKEA